MALIKSQLALTDAMTAPLQSINRALSIVLNSFESMQSISGRSIDTASIQTAREELAKVGAALEQVKKTPAEPVKVPVTWKPDDFGIFTGTGVERFQQEVQSTNTMLSTLHSTQKQIMATATKNNLLPANAVSDMNNMQNRLQAIQQRIQTIESNPLNIGADAVNAELEQLRNQLHQAVQGQEALNQAVENMDIEAANKAYLQMSQTIGNTERYIRDNVDEQGRFNQKIAEGTTGVNNLADTIKRAVGAYATISTVGNVLNLSDQLTSTTARLDMMNDGQQKTEELTQMIYQAAQNARGSFFDMADVVARFGNNAKDAFSSSAEVVAFAELVQKQMTIAGAGTQEASNAMVQLSQALGSGVLRGDELNAIFEQAPNLIQNIADYLNVDIGKIREMAQEGQLSANVVKNAIFESAGEIEAQFNSMPKTFGQVWQSFQNTALMSFQPVLGKLNEIANNSSLQSFVESVTSAIATVSNLVLGILETMISAGSFVADNWSILAPIITGVAAALIAYNGALIAYNTIQAISNGLETFAAFQGSVHAAALAMEAGATFGATAAQYGFNAALLACPITWIIIAVIALVAVIYAVVAAVNKFAGTSISATGIIMGAFFALGAFLLNTFVVPAQNYFATLANFFGNVFNNPIAAVKVAFYDMCLTIIGYIRNLASAIENLLNKIPGVTVNITSGLDGFYSGIERAQRTVKDASGWREYVGKMDYFDLSSAAKNGYTVGQWIDNKVTSLFDFSSSGMGMDGISSLLGTGASSVNNPLSDIGDKVGDVAGNTGSIAASMNVTEEDLKYLRDVAEQETINRFTTAEVKIDMTGMTNRIDSDMDLDGVLNALTEGFAEALTVAAEGVHV